MSNKVATKPRLRSKISTLSALLVCVLMLTGCLEQYQTTRLPGGALTNFVLHLHNGELDDAMAYFAPGIVTPSAELDASVQAASEKVKLFDLRKMKATDIKDLDNGEKQVTITGQERPRTPTGQPTPGPEDNWKDTDVITAKMVERGPGWRLLDFQVLCCDAGSK